MSKLIELIVETWQPFLVATFLYTLPLALLAFVIGLSIGLFVAIIRVANVSSTKPALIFIQKLLQFGAKIY
ncbi:MAG: hypothetical protein ACRCWQ_08825, partial [Bacilli bacterium]